MYRREQILPEKRFEKYLVFLIRHSVLSASISIGLLFLLVQPFLGKAQFVTDKAVKIWNFLTG